MPPAAGGSIPAYNGWAGGKTPVECRAAAKTGAPRASASATSSATAPEADTSSPATIAREPIGDSANSVASSSTDAATVRRSIVDAGGTSTSPSASRVDIGSDTNTGPTGGE